MDGTPGLDLRVPARPDEVGRLRRGLRRWLLEVLDDADLADDLTLATSEALENAADHAFVGRDPGTMSLTASAEGGRVVIEVRDDGRWHDSPSGPSRGRGIALMEGLTESATVVTGTTGTVVTLVGPPRERCGVLEQPELLT